MKKGLLFLVLLSQFALANPTPVLKCKSADDWVKADILISNSSTPNDEFDKFQVNIDYFDEDEEIRINKIIRYQEVYDRFDEGEELLFYNHFKGYNFVINIDDLTGMMNGPLCLDPGYEDSCMFGVDMIELECEAFSELSTLKVKSWDLLPEDK